MLDFMGGRGFDVHVQRAAELEEHDSRVPLAFRPGVQLTLLRAWTGELDAARTDWRRWVEGVSRSARRAS